MMSMNNMNEHVAVEQQTPNAANVVKNTNRRRKHSVPFTTVSFIRIRANYSRIKPTYRTIFKTTLFTSIAMIIAILIVCLTTSKPSKLCQLQFKSVIGGKTYQHNSNPRSLAAGDFNHDTFLDIVVANSGTDNIGIFLNYGNNTFAKQMINFTTGDHSRPVSVVLGDFNSDMHLDIVVANYDTHSIGIFLGYGNGTFASQIIFFTGPSRPVSMAVGDINNDHRLDVVVTNDGTDSIGILFGYGNGSFGNLITYFTGYDSRPYSVEVADFNNDHYLDIAIANYGTDNIGVFLSHGNGSFTSQTTYSTSSQSNPYSLAVNDCNNDGQLDIAVANSGTNDVGIFFGYGNGSFAPQTKYSIPPGSNPHSIRFGDFNQDNELDIAISNYDTNNISILIGYGNGSFATPTMHSTGIDSGPFGMTVNDFNNDNQSDIAVTNFGTNNVYVLIGYQMVQSENPTVYSTGDGSRPNQIAIGDFDNDTQLDLIVANSGSNNVGVFLGYGNGSFQEQITYSTGDNSHPLALAVSDLDNDYRLDIIVGNSDTEFLGILYGYGNGTFATVVTHFAGDSSTLMSVTTNDFNNDSHTDIAFADYGTNSIGIFLGYGNRNFGNVTTYPCGTGARPLSIAVADFNNDERLDLIVANYGIDQLYIFLGFGDGTFSLFTTYSTGDGSFPYMTTVADLNKDNHFDVIVANSGTNTVGVIFGFGNGSFDRQLTYSTGTSSTPYWISVADLNNDYWLDLAVANSNLDNVGVLLRNRQGVFSNQTAYSTGFNSQPYATVVGDFNKDNRLDIAVANFGTNNIAILLGHLSEDSVDRTADASANFNHENQFNSTITNWITDDMPILLGDYYADFLSQRPYSTGSSSRPYALALVDLNNDTKMDLVVTNSGSESFGILLGLDNESFGTEMIRSTGIGSNPQSVIVDDFNRDNQLDVVVTDSRNDSIIVLLGSGNGTFETEMTYSTDFGSNPSALAVSDFNNDNYLDLVVTNQGTDSIGIFFGYDYTLFARQKPYDNEKNAQPISVAVGDFNNDGQLDIVSAFYGTSTVGVFLGYGNGTFTPIMTYAYVRASHPWSVAVGDFNNDSQLDITVANWGIDSIGILLGYGNGSFAKPVLYSSAFGSRPVSVAVGDFNNDRCLDITTANYGGDSIAVFLGYGNGSFQDVITLSTGIGSKTSSVTVVDINNDTQLDIIVANEGTSNVGILLGYGNGTFAEQMTSSTGANSYPWYAIAGDFSNDGRFDLAIANYGASNVGILYGYGNGSFGNLQTYTTGIGSNPTCVNVGDFNNDTQLDIIVSDETSKSVGIFFGYSDGTFASISIVPTGQGSMIYGIAVGDFNSDNRVDFTVSDNGDNNVVVFLSHGNKPFGGQTTFFIDENSRPSSLAVGHFNNDSQLDIVVANYGAHNIGILLGYGNRMFSNVTTYSTGNNSYPMSLDIGDFNNDSLTDIVVANSETDNIIVFIGYANGSFSSFVPYSMGASSKPVSVTVGDFNGDYRLDIAVANFGTNNVCVLFGFGNGTFTNQTWYPLDYDSRPNWIIFKDLNNDGREDIAVATYGTDNIKILWNLC